MVIWGAIWGAVLGLLWRGHGWEWHMVLGAVLGALAGRTLRGVVRTEFEALQVKLRQGPAAAAAPAQAAPIPGPTAIPAEVSPTQPQTQSQAVATPASTAAAPPRPAIPAQPNIITVLLGKARDWLFGGNTIVRVGVLVLFVGLAFLAKYAVDNAMLPPELRLAAIGAAGIGLFVFGFRLRRKTAGQMGYALTLQGAGVAVLYLTVFAAFRLYHFLPAGAAFAALGLICAFSAVIAMAQNALPMAFIGFAGGFAAPILVSTGQGNHVALFTYYLVLGIAIAGIAWARAWRPLNLLGFFATFGVATAWGVLKYRPEQLASTEPFLMGFFLIYVAASVMYALRHSLVGKKAVDATMVFGVPIAAFALQAGLVRDIEYATAFSSLALGAFYLALGWWMARRKGGQHEASRWMAECFAALGLGFVTLAVPLALDGRWTSAVWAVEGAGVYWMGRRQGRWLARAAGLTLQGLAAVFYLDALARVHEASWPLANPAFIGASMLAGAALAIAWWSRSPAEAPDSAFGRHFVALENALPPVLFWIGFLWWQFALHGEIERAPADFQGIATPVLGEGLRIHLHLVAWVASAFAFHFLAHPARARPWAIAVTPAYTVLPALLVGAIHGADRMHHVFEAGGWATWPLALALHYTMLRRLDGGPPRGWWPWVHAGGVWLLVLLEGNLLVSAIGEAQLWQTSWATVILLVAGTVVLALLSRRAWFEPVHSSWPLDRFARAYLWLAAAPLAAAVALGALLVAVVSSGNSRPLPYVPLLNPTDLSVALALAACALWLVRIRDSRLQVPVLARAGHWPLVLAAIGFIAINTVWLRVAHHFAGVPWNARYMFDSFVVQAGYSILWTLLALGLMVGAFRRGLRSVWMLGAALLGITVLKLFVIDLSNRGGSERIFVFIAVGVLMLVVGYFAPIPPAARAANAQLKETGA